MDAVITAESLTKRFGRTLALDGLDLRVERGTVFGYLGPNGAGKTTTMRILAGLVRPTSGRAAVLGLDSVAGRDEIHRRTGYLPGEFRAYDNLTGAEYFHHLASLRGGVRRGAAEDLAARLGLALDVRIGGLSHGNRQKVGLVQAFMHDPEVVLLDEPSLGLDPLVQREFLAMVREVREEGRTVFLSSHVLDEVEAVADIVCILRKGRVAALESVDKLKAQALRHMELTFDGGRRPSARRLARIPGVVEARGRGPRVHVVVEGSTAELLRVVAPYGVSKVVSREAELEEIFLTYYADDGRPGRRQHAEDDLREELA